ncbi:uncharacterized protein LTR77_008578 [Saxophila tyrrhenica]|uniref:Uncharacterized protein n=1 Tax=Saxophila tyrrhenica TaxID=1690608 RepID=A0AAV9P4B6_9PEZI|nr:hypothetical protein LTR77_008578 [Saxophila tyrrhenica]
MESLMNRMYKKKQAQRPQPQQELGPVRSDFMKKTELQTVKEADSQSMLSSQPSFTKEQPKKKVPLADTRKGRILDTAAAFVGLPHVCSNE